MAFSYETPVPAPQYSGTDWSWLANLPSQFYQGAQQKQGYDRATAFQNGLPHVNDDPNAPIDVNRVANILAKYGDTSNVAQFAQMGQQQQQLAAANQLPGQLQGLLTSGGSGGQPLPPAEAAPGPQPVQAAPLDNNPPASVAGKVPTTGRSSAETAPPPSGSQTVDSMVSRELRNDPRASTAAANLAKLMQVDPNAPLTPEQAARVQAGLDGYMKRQGIERAPDNGILANGGMRAAARGIRNNNADNISDGKFAQSQPGYAGTEEQGRFAKFATPQDGLNAASNLLNIYGKQGINTISGIVSKWAPASDGNNVANYSNFVAKQLGVDPNQPLNMADPGVRQTVASAMAKFESGGTGTETGRSASSGAPAQQQPAFPQVPLPKGYTDPQQAILALRAKAAELSTNPAAAGFANALNKRADDIEQSIQPMKIGAQDTYVDPRTGKVVFQGPYAQGTAAESGSTLEADAARYLQTGSLPPNMGRGMQGAAQATAIRQRATQLAEEQGIDPASLPGRWQEYKAHQAGIKDFQSGKHGDAVRSFNVLVGHLGTLEEAGNALQNGDVRAFNQIGNEIAKQTGKPAPTNFEATKAIVGDEIVKAIVGSGGGALGDREEMKRTLDAANSPAQLAGVINHYRELAKAQLQGLEQQYKNSTGLDNFSDMLLPGTKEFFKGGAASPPSMPRVSSKQEYDALPKGSRYIAPDGSIRTKN